MSGKTLFAGFLIAAGLLATAAAREPESKNPLPPANSAPAVHALRSEDDMRMEGEKRFRANCSRCHQSPHKFPPRMMLTIERHMRVRALITDEDLRLIVRYMEQ